MLMRHSFMLVGAGRLMRRERRGVRFRTLQRQLQRDQVNHVGPDVAGTAAAR
jgi:hypothetical protein